MEVLIFCENKSDVDDVHEYLLLKAVEAGPVTRGLLCPQLMPKQDELMRKTRM